jgi:hypothetical protein
MTAVPRLEGVVREFVARLEGVVKEEIRDRLERGLGNGRGAKSGGNGDYRAKGEKRSADEIEALEAKFLEYVGKHPGLRIEQINKELGTSTKDLMLPIRKLIAAKRLKTEGERRATKYSLSGRAHGAKGRRGRSK